MSILELTRKSVGIKVAVIGFLVLILLIPAGMVRSLIHEREGRRMEAIREVSSKWGDAQTIVGPVLTVPYKEIHKNPSGSTYTTMHNAYLLPDVLEAESSVDPEIRYRGIYEVALYTASVKLRGSFDISALEEQGIDPGAILWEKVSFAMGISDLRGVRDYIEVMWEGKPLKVEPVTENSGLIKEGISSNPLIKPGANRYKFAAAMTLNGSEKIQFSPLGKETNVKIDSTWKDPSFVGEFLPKEREVTSTGFTALWDVQYLNRSYPQIWKDQTDVDLASSVFGVELLFPADSYQKTERTAKYAVLFIGLAFLAFFLIEVLNSMRIHPVQYLLVGVALVVFYTLLLSLSEHIGFGIAYSIASVALVSAISGYSASILRSVRLGMLMTTLTGTLYGYMFVVLQLEDYALLFGSVGIFSVVVATMFMTRKVDWYSIGNGGGAAATRSPMPGAQRITSPTTQQKRPRPSDDRMDS